MNYRLAQAIAVHYMQKYPSLRGLPLDQIIIRGMMRNSGTQIRKPRQKRSPKPLNLIARANKMRKNRRANILKKRRGL